MDLIIYAVVALLVAWTGIKVTWFTFKKVAGNIVIGYLTYFVMTSILGLSVPMGVISWIFTALLGPIPVILVWLFG